MLYSLEVVSNVTIWRQCHIWIGKFL
jgi:hypothetical protein